MPRWEPSPLYGRFANELRSGVENILNKGRISVGPVNELERQRTRNLAKLLAGALPIETGPEEMAVPAWTKYKSFKDIPSNYYPPRMPRLRGGLSREEVEASLKYQQQHQKLDAWKKDVDEWIQEIPENDPIVFETNNMVYAITKDTMGGWRATSFSKSDYKPWGHINYKTRKEAVMDHIYEERIDDLPFQVRPLRGSPRKDE